MHWIWNPGSESVMRVLMLPQSYPPRVGGLEAVAHALAVQLAGRGHEVRVLTNRYPRDLPRHEVRDGIDVQRALFLAPRAGLLARGRLDLWLASLPLAPAAGRRLRRLVEEFRPDVVNVHFPDAMIPFVLALRRAHRFRLVVSLHGHEVMRFGGGAAARGGCRPLCRLLREADAVTACSRDLLDAATRLEPAAAARGVVIHNGIDPARFGDTARFAHPRPYVLALGRLTHKKGFDLLLEALARVAPDHPAVDLVLAGDGEERPSLEAAAARLGLARRVYFFGKASAAEVVRLLNGCLFLAVPSRDEAFGVVALEALAAGKPVLATRVGGLGEFLDQFVASAPGNAPVVLVPPSPDGLAEGLRACLRSEWLAADRREAARTILQDWTWSQAAQKYEEVLAG
jgi:glycogen(starch) synthase